MRRALCALLIATSLGACSDTTVPVDARPNLPPLAATCMKHPIPEAIKGKPIPVFALENRKAAIMNALAVGNCQKFYKEVLAAYGAK